MSYTRCCYICGAEITYKYKGNYHYSIKTIPNIRCKSCYIKESCKTQNRKGNNNSFYGKKHSEETITRIQEKRESKKYIWKSEEFKEKMSEITSGKNNGMYGKRIFDVWVEKYGIEIALIKQSEWKARLSARFSGDGNPMYGKDPPSGSGGGCGGWYKGFHFRSLRELNYILYLEDNNIRWETADRKKFRVKYVSENGKDRTYCPDFVLPDSNRIIECKPKELWNTGINQIKKRAATEALAKLGFIFEMIDPGTIDNVRLKSLVECGDVVLKKKYIFNGDK